MSNRRSPQLSEEERLQVRLASRALSGPYAGQDWLQRLDQREGRLLFQELKSHHSLHVAEGNQEQCARMLVLLEQVAQCDERLLYECRRLEIKEFERRGLGGRALQLMEELYLTQGRSRKNPQRGAEILMEYGILHDRYGDKEEALRLFRNAARRYTRAEQPYNQAAAWFNSASVLYDLKRYRTSERACERGFEFEAGRFPGLRTHLYLQRANCRERLKEIDEACQDYLRAAAGYGNQGDRRQQINILFRVGWLLGRVKKVDEAIPLLEQALRLAQELDYALGLANFHLHRAQFLEESGLSEGLLRHLHSALTHAQMARNDRIDKLARGVIYRRLGQRNRSLTFYLEAKAPLRKPNSLKRAHQGTYVHRGHDGYGTRPWRSPPRTANKNVTFLVRLLAELGRRTRRVDLISQSRAVAAWEADLRQGRWTF